MVVVTEEQLAEILSKVRAARLRTVVGMPTCLKRTIRAELVEVETLLEALLAPAKEWGVEDAKDYDDD